MNHERNSESLCFRGVAIIAGRNRRGRSRRICHRSIGRRPLAIRRLVIENAKFKSLEIQDLSVKRLRAAEVIVSDSLMLPLGNEDREIRQ